MPVLPIYGINLSHQVETSEFNLAEVNNQSFKISSQIYLEN